MPLLDNELARREREQVVLRGTPMRVAWAFADLPAADGHTLALTFACSVRAVPDRIERRMLEEVLLSDGRSRVMAEDVVSHFLPQLRTAALRVAHEHPASAWINDEAPKAAAVEALRTAANAVAFACGLEVLPPFHVDVRSESFERQQLRAAQQAMIERQAAGQVEHFQRATELLRQFQSLRAGAPELSASRILQQVGAADRGSMLQMLLMAAAERERTETLWVVAGPYLVRVEAGSSNDEGRLTPKPDLIPLPPTLGPLRSVQCAQIDGNAMLLVGARSGVMMVDPRRPHEPPRTFQDAPAVETQHGFNRVVYLPTRRELCATHADAGVVCWDIDAPDEPRAAARTLQIAPELAEAMPRHSANTFVGHGGTYASYAGSMRTVGGGGGRGAIGPRNLLLSGDTLLFSIGGRVYRWEGDSAQAVGTAMDAELIAIIPVERQLAIVCENGAVSVLDRDGTPANGGGGPERRAGRLRAAAPLPWLDSTRLLLAGDEGPIQCVGMEDPLVTHYASPYRGLRALATSASLVVAVSPDRQRLVLWNAWDGRQPAGELFLTALTRHRIADVTLARQ
jgi:hypothetical protein